MKVSVIVPVFNAAEYLRRCLDSICNQTWADYEVVLIDDGSVDESGKICDEYSKNDDRIRVYHKENGGSASARNLGLSVALGDYIAFLDADDFWNKNFLERMISCAEKYDADVVQCEFEKTKGEAVIKIEKNFEKVYSGRLFLNHFCQRQYVKYVVLWNKIYCKSLFDKLKFPVGKGVDDEYLICEILYRAEKVVQISDVLYNYFLSPNSQMRSAPSMKRLDSVDAIESQLNFFARVGENDLYEKLLYRYYSVISDVYFYIKHYFPQEKNTLQLLRMKKKFCWLKKMRNVKLHDRLLLLLRCEFPYLFSAIKGNRT